MRGLMRTLSCRYKARRPGVMYDEANSKLTSPGQPGPLGMPPSCQWSGGYLEGGANGEEAYSNPLSRTHAWRGRTEPVLGFFGFQDETLATIFFFLTKIER